MDRAERLARWVLPTLGGLLIAVAYAFTLLVRAGALFAGDGDVGRHVRVGTDILATRTIPRVDLYSHTMGGEVFIPYEWLSEVIYAWAHTVAGLPGVAVLAGLLFAGAVSLVYVTMVRWGVPTLLAFVFGFGSMVLQSMHLLPRPHLFTTLLVAAFALVLHEVRRGAPGNRLLVLPVLMAVWANLHGGFLIGFILLFLFALDAAWQAWRESDSDAANRLRWVGIAGALCFAASLLTPAGLELWPHTTGYLKLDYLVDTTQEYRSPDFHQTLLKLYLITLLYGVSILAWLRSRVDLLGLVVYVTFTAFALHSARNIPLFGVLCLPWMAVWTREVIAQGTENGRGNRFLRWAGDMDRSTRDLVGWPVVLAAGAVITVVAMRPDHRPLYRWSAERYPVEAVKNLESIRGEGPVYNQFEWGGYLLYAAWPEVPVFIDGQTDFYGEELTKQYSRIREVQPGWQDLLDEHGISWALIPPDAPLASALELHPEWNLTYRDSTAVSYVRAPRSDLP